MERGRLLIYFDSCICPLPPSLKYAWGQQSRRLPQLSRKMAASLNVYYRKSAALVLMSSWEVSKQFTSSVVTGDDQGTTPRKLVLQETKTLAGQAIKTILMLCKGMCLRPHSMTELSQSSLKVHSTRCLHEENTNWKLKKGKSVCSKGMYFWELTIVSDSRYIYLI